MTGLLIAAAAPEGGTFSASNAVGLPVEIGILFVLTATFVGGFVLLISMRPDSKGKE